uniref:Uncharacterized protein n=1 Tax=Eutreptiella gymnastica TaxID=73025 RepID=A0A7S1N6N4_9EUGL
MPFVEVPMSLPFTTTAHTPQTPAARAKRTQIRGQVAFVRDTHRFLTPRRDSAPVQSGTCRSMFCSLLGLQRQGDCHATYRPLMGSAWPPKCQKPYWGCEMRAKSLSKINIIGR